jgi:hypothetical protein
VGNGHRVADGLSIGAEEVIVPLYQGRLATSSAIPVHKTWMPMQKRRNAESREMMVVPVTPTAWEIRLDDL